MNLLSLKEEIKDTMRDAIVDAIEQDERIAVATVNTTDGYIDLMVTRGHDASCHVTHDDDIYKSSPNLEEWVEKILMYYRRERVWREIEREEIKEVI